MSALGWNWMSCDRSRLQPSGFRQWCWFTAVDFELEHVKDNFQWLRG